MKKVLITGSRGFIGRNLVDKLISNYDIKCPYRDELNLLDENAVQKYLLENKFDIIIHAANHNTSRYKAVEPDKALDANLRMFFNLERCQDLYGKMYYFGSGAEYDMRHYRAEMAEDYFDMHVPQDAYGFSKYIMSKHCGISNNIFDLRLFGVYGKYEEWERRFISNAICRVLVGKNITIEKNVYFDYLWIDDLAKIMEWFIENKPVHKHYNVCRGKKIDLYSLACIVRECLGADCDIIVKESGWKPEYTGNNERLLKEIGKFPFIGFEDSIYKLCEHYKKNRNIIDADLLI